jgi:hypothetical protein
MRNMRITRRARTTRRRRVRHGLHMEDEHGEREIAKSEEVPGAVRVCCESEKALLHEARDQREGSER